MAEPTDTVRPTNVREVAALTTAAIMVEMLTTVDDDTFTRIMQSINDARAEVQRIRDEEYPPVTRQDVGVI